MLNYDRFEDRLQNLQHYQQHPEAMDNGCHAQEYINHLLLHGYNDVLSQLKLNGIENTARSSYENQMMNLMLTSLHECCQRGDVRMLLEALASGTGVGSIDAHGDTPLTMAAAHGHTEIVHILLAVGADRNHQNVYGETALSLARRYNRTGVIAELTR